MYFNTLLKTFALLCMVVAIYGQSKPKYLTIQGQIFDHHPFYDNNFEPEGGSLTVGLVNPVIDSVKRIPVLNSLDANNNVNQKGRMYTPGYFQYFFYPNPNAEDSKNSGKNVPILYNVVLEWDDDNGVYVYNNQKFFPINNKGFDSSTYKTSNTLKRYSDGDNYQNFHFCLKLSSKFTYGGYEVFDFTGDDDVYVFINDRLAIDLGGLHTAESKKVTLSQLGLTKGKTYNFDFFYCERHTTASTIKITTNLEVYCPWTDFCGVCQGDGSTCCSEDYCSDSDPCTKDACPSPTTVIASGKTVKDYCTHTFDNGGCDELNTKCKTYQCEKVQVGVNTTTKNCKLKTQITTCANDPKNCYPATTCDDNLGCVSKYACQWSYSNCYTGVCNAGTCEVKTPEICGDEASNLCSLYKCGNKPTDKCQIVGAKCLGNSSEPCIQYGCDFMTGSCTQTKVPDSECKACCLGVPSTPCQVKKCIDGQCKVFNKTSLPEYDDNNKCTINTCDEATGNMVYTPIPCGGCDICNTASGKCEPNDNACLPENKCEIPNCVHLGNINDLPTGECQNKQKSDCGATDTNKCHIWTCEPGADGDGCTYQNVTCPSKGNCLISACDENTGECVYSNKVCESPAFCIVAECDEAVGCVQYDRRCDSDDGRCQRGVCVNGTSPTDGKCESVDYDPKPFVCKTAAVVSTAVAAGIAVAGAVALGAFIYGGKKGYDYWKEHHNVKFSASTSNPLYVESPNGGVNPLYGTGAAE